MFFLFSNFCYFRMLLYILRFVEIWWCSYKFHAFCLECEQTCYVWLLQKKTQEVFTPHKALKCKIDTLDTRDTQTCPRCLPQNIRIPYSYWKATIFCHNVLLKTNGVQDGATSFLGFLSVQSSLLTIRQYSTNRYRKKMMGPWNDIVPPGSNYGPYFAGWWFQPLWKILVKLEIFPK